MIPLFLAETQSTKSSVISSPITSLASTTASSDKQPPSNAQRRSDALLEQLTTPLKNPMASVTSHAQSTAADSSPGTKDSVDANKDNNASQQGSVDMKVRYYRTVSLDSHFATRIDLIVRDVCL